MILFNNTIEQSDKSENYYTESRPEMVPYVPRDARKILDVGCGEGIFGQQLKQQLHTEVWGIELNSQVAVLAGKRIDKVLVGDVSEMFQEIPDRFFDCIVFNDVLEHLIDPYSLLISIKRKLAPDGVIVCSIPNVRFFFVLVDLNLKKQWKYENAGILDKTHLRFFTERSIRDMFQSLDYELRILEGIKPTHSLKYKLFNLITFGFFSDSRFLQFACVAKPK